MIPMEEKYTFIGVMMLSSLMEIVGILTMFTNEGIVPSVDLGFTVPALIPSFAQGMLLLVSGGLLTVYSIMKLK